MVNILLYNNATNRIEQYARELYEAMPYNNNRTLTVAEFRGKSASNLVWTDRSTMQAWNVTRAAWGRPIYIGYAFRRIGEGGHADMSQHYAGTAFDVGQNLSSADRDALRRTAAQTGAWTYVEPQSMTPTWVHFDKRFGVPACATGGYPTLSTGSRGNYVALLQDALETAGIPAVGVDGIFGAVTRRAVVRFQSENGLVADGVVGCATWRKLTSLTNNKFRQ